MTAMATTRTTEQAANPIVLEVGRLLNLILDAEPETLRAATEELRRYRAAWFRGGRTPHLPGLAPDLDGYDAARFVEWLVTGLDDLLENC
jgi:hypothetical protein